MSSDKSKCSTCGAQIKGRNATNLLHHLRSKHKDVAEEFKKVEAERKGSTTSGDRGTEHTIQVQCNVVFAFQR